MLKEMMLAACLAGTAASAATISVNFIGGSPGNPDGSTIGAGQLAGLVDPTDSGNPLWADTYVDNWVNAAGASGSGIGLITNDGNGNPASFSFNTPNGTWGLFTPEVTGNDNLWGGYLDNFGGAATTITVDGLVPDPLLGSYDVLVYFDGSNGGQWRKTVAQIGATSIDGEDSENTNWGTGQNSNGYFQLPTPGAGANQPFETPPPGRTPNNDEGNYFRFTGLTGTSFTLNISTGPAGGTTRAPINGFQIVGVRAVPEPGTMILLGAGLAAIAGLRFRQRASRTDRANT